MKKIITEDSTIFVNAIKEIRVIKFPGVTNYAVVAILYDNVSEITIENPNVIILNDDESGDLIHSRQEAILFKDFLERKLDNQWETIFVSDIMKDVRDYIDYQKSEHKSTMVDISKLKLNEKGEVIR